LTLSEYVFALGAAVSWAVSASVVSWGLTALRAEGQRRVPAAISAVLVALFVGLMCLAVVNGFTLPPIAEPLVILGGLLTFPLGTGLYYVVGIEYSDRAEVASQFANVKPVVSIALGVVLFQEAFDLREMVVCGLILVGVALLLVSGWRHRDGWSPVLWGLTLAAAWALGEGCIRAATVDFSALEIAYGALASSLLLVLVGLGLYVAGSAFLPSSAATLTWADLRLRRGHIAFALHGLLSFGLAYTLFFESISRVGLSGSVMITVFWPVLALGGAYMVSRFQAKPYRLTGLQLSAFALLSAGSVFYIAAGALFA
jgi:drug/metabolite transporter (DMT)-like permease